MNNLKEKDICIEWASSYGSTENLISTFPIMKNLKFLGVCYGINNGCDFSTEFFKSFENAKELADRINSHTENRKNRDENKVVKLFVYENPYFDCDVPENDAFYNLLVKEFQLDRNYRNGAKYLVHS